MYGFYVMCYFINMMCSVVFVSVSLSFYTTQRREKKRTKQVVYGPSRVSCIGGARHGEKREKIFELIRISVENMMRALLHAVCRQMISISGTLIVFVRYRFNLD